MKLLIAGGVGILVLLLVAAVVSMFATVTIADAAHYLGRYEPSQLVGPQLGRMYQFADGKLLGDPVCDLELDESQVDGPTVADYRFTNVVGELLPFLAALNRFLWGGEAVVGVPTLGQQGRSSLAWRATETYLSPAAKFEVQAACSTAVERLIQQGAVVCTISAVLTANVAGAPPYAVRFKDECVSYCPSARVGSHVIALQACPRTAQFVPKPSFANVSFSTWVKAKLGLISFDPVSHVHATALGQATQ